MKIGWKESYRIGIQDIDEQHKKLFLLAEQVDALLDAGEHVDQYDEIVTIIDELRDYVAYHFAYEEKMMLHISYNKFFAHKVTHQDFVEYINKLVLDEIDDNQSYHMRALLDTINTWLVTHVLESDIEWAKVYQAQQ